jgi:membrane protease YdiL (CAAX protease family)
MGYQKIASGVYLALSFLFLASALFTYWRTKRSRPYFTFGTLLSMTVAVVAVVSFFVYNIPALTFSISFIAIQIFILSGAGAYVCSKLSLPSMPYFRYFLSRSRKAQWLKRVSIRFTIFSFIAVILYSIALFALFRPSPSPLLEDFWYDITEINKVFSRIILVTFALGEEIIFRLFLQNFLALYLSFMKYGWVIAIFISSSVWAVGHSGMVEPEWVKFLHVLGIGVILGFLMRKQGVESCMIVHSMLNLSASILPT